MANFVIKGIYESKAALDTAELETAQSGDTYMVGTKAPYDAYTYTPSKSAFIKGAQVGRKTDMEITVDDVNQDIPVAKIFEIKFLGEDDKTVMVRKGLHLGEIHFYVPLED